MENLIFALNSTIPVFLVILLGWFLRYVGMLDERFTKPANAYVFKCALPASLFRSMAGMDFYTQFDPAFCLFCMVSTWAMFLGIWLLAWLLIRDKGQIGAFAQASVRSSAAILGLAFANAIYGDSGMVPMMIMAAVPFFNLLSVVILSFSPQVGEDGRLLPSQSGTAAVKRACINILKNPIILGILAGMPFALLRVSVPEALDGAIKSVGSTASPIALLVMGASFSGSEALTRWKGAVWSGVIKLLLLPAILLPLAAAMGFRDSQMVAILIMAGSPTTVTAFVMAKSMHADGVLSSNAVLLSTVASSVTITFWLYLLRSFGLI